MGPVYFVCLALLVSWLGTLGVRAFVEGREGVYALKYVGARFLLSVPKYSLVCLPGDQNDFKITRNPSPFYL